MAPARSPNIPGWDGPDPHAYDAKDYPSVTHAEIGARLIAVSHRANVIVAMLDQLKIPLNRFTHEALLLAAEQIDFELTNKENGE